MSKNGSSGETPAVLSTEEVAEMERLAISEGYGTMVEDSAKQREKKTQNQQPLQGVTWKNLLSNNQPIQTTQGKEHKITDQDIEEEYSMGDEAGKPITDQASIQPLNNPQGFILQSKGSSNKPSRGSLPDKNKKPGSRKKQIRELEEDNKRFLSEVKEIEKDQIIPRLEIMNQNRKEIKKLRRGFKNILLVILALEFLAAGLVKDPETNNSLLNEHIIKPLKKIPTDKLLERVLGFNPFEFRGLDIPKSPKINSKQNKPSIAKKPDNLSITLKLTPENIYELIEEKLEKIKMGSNLQIEELTKFIDNFWKDSGLEKKHGKLEFSTNKKQIQALYLTLKRLKPDQIQSLFAKYEIPLNPIP